MGIRHKEVITKWDIYYPKLVNYFKIYRHTNLSQRWKTDQHLADWVLLVRKNFSSLSDSRKKLLAQLKFLSYKEWYWLQSYEQLLTFKKQFKHLRIPSYPPYDKLYNWLLLQKEKQHTLSQERRMKLNEIGAFKDGSLYLEEKWQQRFKELLAYKRRYKDCRVPANWKNNPALAKWVTKQRSLKRIGKLLPYRKKSLEEIGFTWSQSNEVNKKEYYDKVWEKKYRMLEKYYQEYGHSAVVHEWKDNPSLARWAADQRMNFKNGKLSKEKITRLSQLDFIWNPLEAQWMKSFYQLQTFYLQNGHTRIPTSAKYLSLSKWTSYIRTRKKELSKDRIALMDSLSFEWKVQKRKIFSWDEMYRKVVAYQKKRGILPVNRNNNPKLSKWLYDQRTERVKHSPERRKLLTKIGIVFDHKYSIERI